MMVLARFCSLRSSAGAVDFLTFCKAVCHLSTSERMSCSTSASEAFIAAVRIMTPKFLGSTPCAMRLSRFFSSAERIFCEMKTFDENGTSTTLRPASEMSAVRRGPLVEMASLATCTMTVCPTSRWAPILPLFSSAGSSLIPSRRTPRLPGCCAATSFLSDENCDPRSR